MAVIALSEDSAWFVARWAFRRFLEDVSVMSPGDEEIAYKAQQAIALDGLLFDLLERDFAHRILRAIRATAVLTLEESAPTPLKWREGLDEEGQRMYLRAVRKLLRLVDQEVGES